MPFQGAESGLLVQLVRCIMYRVILALVVVVAFCSSVSAAQTLAVGSGQGSWEVTVAGSQLARERPPVNTRRLLGEYAGGVGLGAALGILGGLAGFVLAGRCDESFADYFGCLGGMYLGALVGFMAGATIGVHSVGSSGPEGGSWLATLAGVALGLVVSGLVVSERWPDVLQVIFGLSIPVWGGIGGFNLSRRYDEGAGPMAGRRVQVRVGVPAPVLVRTPGGRGYSAAVRWPLLQIKL